MHTQYHGIENIVGNVLMLRASDVGYGDLAEVSYGDESSLAQVIQLDGDQVYLQVFSGSRGVPTNATVRFLGHRMNVPFSEDLLGRIFDGSARPRDARPQLDADPIGVAGPSVNPAQRIIPRKMVRTGIPMIDVFNTLVQSQKLPIFSVAGEPYNPLLARIALQAEVDVIILGGMGLKYDDYLYFRDTLEEAGALSRAVMYVHTAADPTVECLFVPDLCLEIGRAHV